MFGDLRIRCTPCDKSIVALEAIKFHREKYHTNDESCLKYNFYCPTCDREVHADDWFVHLWYEHNIPEAMFVPLYIQNRSNAGLNATFSCWEFWENLKIEGSLDCGDAFMRDGGFLCQLCLSGTKSRRCYVLVLLWYDHLKEEHRNHLPKRNFCCKICNNIIDGSGWNEHVKKKHANWLNEDGGKLYCGECKAMVPKENWNKHVQEEYEKGFLKSKDDFILWCEIQKAMISGKNWNFHVEAEMKKFSLNGYCGLLCRVCCVMVSKDNFNKHVMDNRRCCFLPDPFFTEPEHWCKICGKIVLMVDWNKHMTSQHKESLREGHVECLCRICSQEVPPKDWNAHAEGVSGTQKQSQHSTWFESSAWDLFCPECNIMVSGNEWNEHMKAEHKGFDFGKMFYCSQHKEYFLKLQSKENHVKNKHQGLFYCGLCDDVFFKKNKGEHFEENYPGKGYICACGVYFRRDCDDGKTEYEHLSQHSVKCELCNKEVTIEHMKSKHGCDLKVCRLEQITQNKVWNWCHAPSRESMFSCPMCWFEGILPHIKQHVHKSHDCAPGCRFNVQRVLEHDASCMNGLTECQLCKQKLARTRLGEHGMRKHGYDKECPMLTRKVCWHHGKCGDWILQKCPLCGKLSADCSHIFEKHFNAANRVS